MQRARVKPMTTVNLDMYALGLLFVWMPRPNHGLCGTSTVTIAYA